MDLTCWDIGVGFGDGSSTGGSFVFVGVETLPVVVWDVGMC